MNLQMKIELGVKNVWQMLNGVLCVYKPRDLSIEALKKLLINRIVEQGNELDDSSVPLIEMPVVEPHPESQALVIVDKRTQLDYSRHPLMCGRAFVAQDLMLEQINEIEPSSSGVCAFAVGPECYEIDGLRQRPWINSYRMEAKLGEETEKHAIRGKTIVRAEWEHVTRHKVEKLLTRLRAQYKRASFKLAEVDLHSQEAFEIARRGAPRPKILDSPIVYNISVSSFRTPYFNLNLQVTGETDYFLRALVHEIGLCVGSTACTRKLQRIRLGPFSVNHALLEKDFNLKPILRNILMCNKVLEVASANEDRVVQVKQVADLESTALIETFATDEVEPEPEDCLRIPWGREYSTV